MVRNNEYWTDKRTCLLTFYNKEHPPKGILVIQNNVFGALFPVFI